MPETGDYHKYDYGKPRFDLIPMDALIELAKLYETGARKYDENGWLKNGGMDYHRLFRSLMSHAVRYWNGEDYDSVDGQHHMTSVAWCALGLLTYDLRGLGNDDRPVRPTKDKSEDQQDIEQWLREREQEIRGGINPYRKGKHSFVDLDEWVKGPSKYVPMYDIWSGLNMQDEKTGLK